MGQGLTPGPFLHRWRGWGFLCYNVDLLEKIIGLDIGGSGTGFVVMDEGGRVYFRGFWPLSRWDDPGAIARRVSDIAYFDAVGIGAAGAWTPEERMRLAEAFKRCGKRIRVISDAEAALIGAFTGKPGIIVIAGTGSVAIGMGKGGKLVRAGGFGHLFGDKGSGFWIAKEAISSALEAIEGLGNMTRLTSLLEGEPREFVLSLMKTDSVRRVSSLAPKVIQIAEEGDETALRIIGEGLRHLVGLAKAIISKTGYVPVSYHGGLFGSSFYLNRFKEMCALEGLEVREPEQSGAWGAAWVAGEATGPSGQI
ncbi:MAG: BadF/BadG/BcrA/BcrD ATPase family protein [candidate division WOR-3 bacterium]